MSFLVKKILTTRESETVSLNFITFVLRYEEISSVETDVSGVIEDTMNPVMYSSLVHRHPIVLFSET